MINRRQFTEMGILATSSFLVRKAFSKATMVPTIMRIDPPQAFPRKIANIETPDSKFAKLAIDTARECSAPYLLHHAARTFYFGALVGRAQKMTFDSEILFLAAMMHDLGLTETQMGELPFEIQGAQRAKAVLIESGYPADKSEVVWDGIAMHTQALSDFKRPEIALVGAGAGADVTGSGLEMLQPVAIKEIVAAFPRLHFKREFINGCATVIARYPKAATRSFMRDIGERSVPGFKPANICDKIATSPFDE